MQVLAMNAVPYTRVIGVDSNGGPAHAGAAVRESIRDCVREILN